jgi:hypothetical protein
MKTALVVFALLLSACGGSFGAAAVDSVDGAGDGPELDAPADAAAPDAPRELADGARASDAVDAVDASEPDRDGSAALDAPSPSDAGDGGCSVIHDDGFGEHWTDCVPLGTYTWAQAMATCATHTGDAKYCADLGAGTDAVCSNQDSYPTCACWAYAGALAAGFVNHGNGGGCHPPGGGLGTDTMWD